jgi:hypothetical protein
MYKKRKFNDQIENAYIYLKEKGQIKYDHQINEIFLCLALGLEPNNLDSWDIIGPLIKLKQYMEVKGYKTSQRHNIKGLYIEPAFKVNHKIKQRRNKCFDQMDRDTQCAYNVDRDELSSINQKELDHSLHVMSLLTQAMNSILRDIK